MSDDNVAADPYDGMTNDELKDVLRDRGLAVSGTKDELLERLVEADAAAADAAPDPDDGQPDDGQPDLDEDVANMSMKHVDATPSNPDFDPSFVPEEGFSEDTLPVTDRRELQLAEWAAANPNATVIPPALLPPAYLDATIATPGLPGGAIG